jgi:hypothetical protein
MRHLPFLILVFLVSCNRKIDKVESDYFSNLKFSLDTVIIDPGDDIIFLENGLLGADKSIDDNYLFNFNLNDHTLEIINLNDLRLEEKIPFEKEGPNGTGSFVNRIKVQNEGQINIGDFNKTALYALDGKKQMTINYLNFDLGGNPWEGGDLIRQTPVLDKDANRLYVLFDRIMDKRLLLGTLILDKYEISRTELKTFDKLYDYSFFLSENKVSITIGPEVGIDKFGTKVILSNQITSALMWYDTDLDSLFIKSYNSQLTADKKVNSYKLEHDTEESLESEYTKYQQEINFLPPFWDEKNQVFYRFSYQELSTQSSEEEHIKSKIYLTVLDKNLNQLGETLVPLLTKESANPFSRQFPKHFAKDGKIWIYENINDEMGFVVLTIFSN